MAAKVPALTKEGLLLLSAQGLGHQLVLQVLKVLPSSMSICNKLHHFRWILLPLRLNSLPLQTQVLLEDVTFQSRAKPLLVPKASVLASPQPLIGKPIPFSEYVEKGFGLGSKEHPSIQVHLPPTPTPPPTVRKVPLMRQEAVPIEQDIDKLVSVLDESDCEEQPVQYQKLGDLCPGFDDWRLLARVVKILPNSKLYEVKKGIHKGKKVKACNFLVIDERGEEAICICYGEVAEKTMTVLKEGQVYQFSKCEVKQNPGAKQLFISLMLSSRIRLIEKHPPIPTHKVVHFPFNRMSEAMDGELVDVVGLVEEVDKVCTIKKQDGSDARRLQFRVVDPESKQRIKVFFWEELIGEHIQMGRPIIIKNVKVNFYRNSLQLISTYNTFTLPPSLLAPDHPVFSPAPHMVLGPESIFSVAELSRQLEVLQNSEKEVHSRLRCRLVCINERNQLHYLSCQKCNKKVNRERYCPKCSHYVLDPQPKYLLNCLMADGTGQLWVTIYSDNAEWLMGKPVAEVFALGEEELHQEVKRHKYKEFVLEVATSRTQSRVKRIERVNQEVESQRLRSQLQQLLGYLQIVKLEEGL